LAAVSSLLEKGHHDVVGEKTSVSSSSTLDDVQTSGRSEVNESPKTCRLSPDSTASFVDVSLTSSGQYCLAEVRDVTGRDMDELTTMSDCKVRSKCEVQALIGAVHRQLRETEQRHFAPLLPASSTASIVSDVMPDCRLIVDHALLQLAAEARQIPAVGSEREALVKQVIQSVIDAHLNTCTYTRQVVEAGFSRYYQVCHIQSFLYVLVFCL